MKQPYVIVLAGSTREGRRYAKLAALPKGRHRVVFSAKQIRRLRHAEIHELPSFRRRPDRHGINAALRYTRGERLMVEMPTEQMEPSEERTPAGPTLRQLEVAYRYNALRDDAEHAAWLESAEVKVEDPSWDAPGDPLADLEQARAKVEDQGDGMGPQTTIDGADEPVEPKAPIRRRKRCPVCQELVFGDEDPAHDAAAHEAVDAAVLGKPVPSPASFFGGKGA